MAKVGKYTSPMEPMGLRPFEQILCSPLTLVVEIAILIMPLFMIFLVIKDFLG